MRVLVADRHGNVKDELDALVESVMWVLNGIGRARLSIAVTSPKAIPENLAPSNRIWIEFENGLPPWGGVIDLPRRWSEGVIEINAYTIEHILQYRITDRSTYFSNAPVGAILARVLREVQAVQHEGIELGQIWLGGQGHYPAYHFKSVWAIIQSIRRMEQCDVVFEPQLTVGRIWFRANLLERWGQDKSSKVLLAEGYNVSDVVFEEQGPLVNYVVAAGAGTTWTERPIVAGGVQESIQQFGLRERLEVYPDVSYESTLQLHCQRILQAQAWPLRRFGLTVVNEEPGRFADYDVGDIVRLQLPSVGWGYDGRVRVIAREFNGRTGVCRLAVDEWTEEQVFIREVREGEE